MKGRGGDKGTRGQGDAEVVSEAAMAQIREKVAEACEIGYAEVTLVVQKGEFRWIRGPAPSVPVRSADGERISG